MTFNENPFQKDTPVTPFSNGESARGWQSQNCAICLRYESESTSEDQAGCKLSYHIDLGFLVGTIPLWVAKEVGCAYDPLYQTCSLGKCRQYYDNPEMPF